MKRKDEEVKDEWSERFGNFYKNSGGIAIVDQPNNSPTINILTLYNDNSYITNHY